MYGVKTDSNVKHNIIHGFCCSLAEKTTTVYFGTYLTNLDSKDKAINCSEDAKNNCQT